MNSPGHLRRTLGIVSLCCAATPLLLPGAAASAQDGVLAHDHPAIGCGKSRALAQRYLAERAQSQRQAEYRTLLDAGLREAFEDTDLLHVDLEIEILPDEEINLIGTNTMTIQSKAEALTQFTFRLRSQFNIDAATVNDGTPVNVNEMSDTTRVVELDRVYGMDEVFTLTIAYSGHAVSRGFGSIEFSSHAGADIVYTLSESYYSYTWWPAKDGDVGEPGNNDDKFTLDMAVISPPGMVTASNGLLEGIDYYPDGRERYRWSSDYPIATYLVCFSSTNYNTWSLDYIPLAGGTMPVLFYIYPEHDNANNRAAWEEVVQMMYTLRDFFGEYPFVDEKYGIYECQFGGGMEHQTFTAQGTFNERITVHEVGHQWWGDMVTCRTWNHIWLNEGFATYSEALWEEFKPGSTGLPALKAKMATIKYTGGGSVYVTDNEVDSLWAIFDGSTTYHKAGWVVHMLRHVLGDQHFFAALAAYRSAFEFAAADTEDFQAVAEQFYPGGDLGWFFQQWIYGERAPAYQWGWDHAQVRGQDYLLIYVDQVQDPSYQRFTMPIDIVVDGTTHVIFNDADAEHFVIPLGSAPSVVQFDPDEWILRSGLSTTAYPAGPPTIVQTSPQPGQILEDDDAGDVEITFHAPVNTSATHYQLTGATTGPVAVGAAYDAANNTVTLTPTTALPADLYTLAVADSVTGSVSGLNLDGEITDPLDPGSLPSGDGLAGGSATVRFTIICGYGDADCDRDVDFDDFSVFQACYTGPNQGPARTGCEPMRFDADTDVDLDDFAAFANTLAGP